MAQLRKNPPAMQESWVWSPGEGKGYPHQYSGVENSMHCVVRGDAKSLTQLSNFHFHIYRTLYFGDYSNFGLPRLRSGKESTCQFRRCKRHGFNSGSGRYPGEGNGNPLQYSCLENSMDKGAWQATVHEVSKKSDTTE